MPRPPLPALGLDTKSAMNACILAYTFYESDFRVMRYAEALVERGDRVIVIALRHPNEKKRAIVRGVRLFRIQERVIGKEGKVSYLIRITKFLLRAMLLMGRFHRKRPFDLVHVHSVPDFLVFAAAIPKLSGAKIILDIHDILPEFYASKFSRGGRGPIFKLLILVERWSCRFSDHVIIANHLWEKKLISRSLLSTKLTTLMNYPDTSIFHPRKGKGVGQRFLMLYPGTVNWHQGLDIAIRAFARIKDSAPHAEFHIIGSGTHWEEIEALVERLKLKDRVVLETSIPLREVAERMALSDLGVIPKRNDPFGGEAFSTKTLEFMASGVPIIVSRTKIDQFYFDDTLVRFFEPENEEDLAKAMLQMIGDNELRTRLSKQGLKFVAENNWGKKKTVYYGLIDRLCSKPKKAQYGSGLV